MKAHKDKLKIAMANACMSTGGLIEASGMPRPTVNKVIAGKSVGPATLGRIARALGVPVEQIIEQEE